MTVIYVDTLFLLNTMVDYLLLLASARLAGSPWPGCALPWGRPGRIVCGGHLPAGDGLSGPAPVPGAAAVLMVLLAFWRSRRLLRQVLIFLALACAFGGGVLAVELLGQRLALGAACCTRDGSEDCAAVGGGVLRPADPGVPGIGRHGGPSGELTRVRLTPGERQVELTGLVDTGNTLTDPATGSTGAGGGGGQPGGAASPGSGPARRSCETRRGRWSGWRMGRGGCGSGLPYRAVGGGAGPAAGAADGPGAGGEEDRGPMLAALSPTPVSDGGAYRVLVGAE